MILNFPFNKNVQFSKFTLEMNNKTLISKVIDKEKAEEKYSDAIASGNTGAMTQKEEKNIKVLIGNIPGNSIIKLTSEFIEFLNTEDMSYCYSTIKNFPIFSGQNFQNKLHKIQAKIKLKTFSKITRLITKGLNINTENGRKKKNQNNKNPNINFSENFMECEIKYYILNNHLKKALKNDEIKIIFRTESMNKLNLLTLFDEKRDETSCILSMVYNKDEIVIPFQGSPDKNCDINYINVYQQNIINSNPSIFIFLLDQSGSMSGNPMKVAIESLILFLQSLPKKSYYQIIGFGSTFRYIYSEKPVK